MLFPPRGRAGACLLLSLVFVVGVLAVPAAAAADPVFRDKVRSTRPSPAVDIRGGGWGHSVGMSQYGAYAMAQDGKDYSAILRHYYSGVSVADGKMPSNIRVGLGKSMSAPTVEAVTGDVPWLICSGGTCDEKKVQPEGRSWTVGLLPDGRWRLTDGDTVVFRGGAGTRLVADFGAAGSVVKAYNPNGSRKLYRWGHLEFSVNSPERQTMYMVLDIPSVELYLRGLGEVPSSWGLKGQAALEAQAVTGRTYAVRLHRSYGGMRADCRCSLLATPANQAYTGYEKETGPYGNLWVAAVTTTAGKIATYDGELISTYYSSSHGGRSENSEDSWAYSASAPYLRSVNDPWSLDSRSGNHLASWETSVGNAAFARFTGAGMAQVRSVVILPGRTAGGSPKTLSVSGVDADGRPRTVSRTGAKGIVGIDLRKAFGFNNGRLKLSTLPSQQVRAIGLAPFRDDDGSVHEYSIVFATSAGIMESAGGDRFNPAGRVSRGAMATYLYNTFKLEPSDRDYYRDDDGSPHETAINAVTAAGIAKGVGKGRFAPDVTLNRAQMATFFKAALGLAPSTANRFSDDNGNIHEPSIDAIAAKGVVSGCTADRFCPARKIRRDQMATFLFQAVEAYR